MGYHVFHTPRVGRPAELRGILTGLFLGDFPVFSVEKSVDSAQFSVVFSVVPSSPLRSVPLTPCVVLSGALAGHPVRR